MFNMKKENIKTLTDKAYHYGIQLVAVGGLTGFFAGITVTLYTLLASMAEEFSRGYYGFFRDHPAFIPLLFIALFAGAIVIGGVLRFIPMIRGSGIPQTEGATRGLLHFKWYRVLTGMFAASLFSIFMGLSAGSEGPSIQIGGACGYGVSTVLRRGESVRRYQITGGACAGLAVAFNAPLTGMAFAFEEAHKRFTPEVFICSFSSVVTAVLTRNLLREAMGLSVGSAFASFTFSGVEAFNFHFCLYVLLAALVCGLVGVAFYFLIFRSKKLFDKITFWKGCGKMIVPFLLAGVCGLITVYAMGGGHSFIETLGSLSENVQPVFSSPVWVTLFIIVALKFIVTVVNIGAGVPCGAFVPMLAIGAGLGAFMNQLCQVMGMDPAYSDALIMICMAVFFTTVVKAPITGIVMVVELTWSFTFLLPVILGVAVGYLIGDVFRTKPVYDRMLDLILEEQRDEKPPVKIALRIRVGKPADGRAVRDIMWPSNALVTVVERGDRSLVPDGKTVLREGDLLFLEGETADEAEFIKMLAANVGEPLTEQDAAAE